MKTSSLEKQRKSYHHPAIKRLEDPPQNLGAIAEVTDVIMMELEIVERVPAIFFNLSSMHAKEPLTRRHGRFEIHSRDWVIDSLGMSPALKNDSHFYYLCIQQDLSSLLLMTG